MTDCSAELKTGIAAVRHAARLCQAVQSSITADSLEKKDKSPVTIADFGSQAIVCRAIGDAFPDDPIVGEEDSAELQEPGNEAFLTRILQELAAVGLDASADDACAWIDRGGWNGEGLPGERFWTLDPIDGTKGFLRGQQYAISLAMIENGQIAAAVVGCPNLPLEATARGASADESVIASGAGSLLVAAKGAGAFVLPIDGDSEFDPASAMRISVSQVSDFAEARLCESVESGHSSHSHSAQIASELGIVHEPARLDSQAKYAVVARGEADIYLRLPTRPGYREKIWDHAGGVLVTEEAGGKVTDVAGKPLDFTHGRELRENRGVIVTNGPLHEQVLVAVHNAGIE